MSTSTKEALAAALRHMMNVKPIGKITVKDLVEICGWNGSSRKTRTVFFRIR